MTTDDDRPAEPAPQPSLLTRRRVLIGSAVAVAAVAGGVAVVRYQPPAQQLSPTPTPSPTPPVEEYLGAMVGAPIDETAMDRWRADIDTLVANGQNLVRTSVYAWLVAPSKEYWDGEAVAFYRQALQYARDRGLAINMVVPGAPDWAQDYDFDEYVDACTWFWTAMRDAYDDQVDLWQPYNEADHAHYQKFTPTPRESADAFDQYLGEFAHMLGVASEVLGRDGTPVTTNLTGWPMDDEREQEWYHVLNAIQPALDVISLDLYPADSAKEIGLLAERMERVRKKYGKPVFVAEIGLQTTPGSWTESDQKRYVPAAIKQLRTVDLWGVCLYELRDNEETAGFGIQNLDGAAKPGFTAVMQAMQPQ